MTAQALAFVVSVGLAFVVSVGNAGLVVTVTRGGRVIERSIVPWEDGGTLTDAEAADVARAYAAEVRRTMPGCKVTLGEGVA